MGPLVRRSVSGRCCFQGLVRGMALLRPQGDLRPGGEIRTRTRQSARDFGEEDMGFESKP